MKKLNIAFLYNVRDIYPDPNNPITQLQSDFDDQETINFLIKHLESCNFNIFPIEANEKAYLKLLEQKPEIDLAFNYAEGIYGADREAQIPAMLEMLQIPYTGSGPLTQCLSLNKYKAKELLSQSEIPLLPHQLFLQPQEKISNKLLYFPMIVKPVSQGSSAGITNESVVFTPQQLKKQVAFILKTFKQPALVENFASGREFSVAMLGNPPQILPIIESNHTILPDQYHPLDSLEVKWIFEEESELNKLICPADISPKLQKKIEKICLLVWEKMNIRDWCRIDIRCDNLDNPYFLEFNSPAGLIPPEISQTSYYPLAARKAGLSFQKLLKKLVFTALERINKENYPDG